MEKSATPSLPTAGLWRRISAMIYESLLLLALLFIADYLFLALTHNASSPLFKALLQAYLLLMMAGYFSWSWLRGQTLAMKTWRIRVVNREGAALTLQQALLRFVLAMVLIPAFGISLIWALFDRDKQFLHDRLAGTRLVRTDA
ncbi:RDD family protein [Sulfuriferula plumbiphila]|nr:RDD family protein [Sulfuriferula plumbiphila]